MNVSEPPQIVFEQPAACSDAANAEEQLRKALAPSIAPGTGWRVTLRIERAGGGLVGSGEIVDAAGAPVGHREVRVAAGRGKAARECASVARAVGVWASLVLDAQVARAKEKADDEPAPAIAVAVLWPAPALNEKPAPEQSLFLAHEADHRSLEIGGSGFLMDGAGTGALAGPALFMVIEAGNAWFLRPTLAFGRTVQPLPATDAVFGTWGAARFEACKRLPGLYLERRGIQLDMCAGGEIGFVSFNQPTADAATSGGNAGQPSGSGATRTLPFTALGPSIGLRGELASDLAVELRGIAGVNLLRETFRDSTGAVATPSLFVGRAELGLSWRVR